MLNIPLFFGFLSICSLMHQGAHHKTHPAMLPSINAAAWVHTSQANMSGPQAFIQCGFLLNVVFRAQTITALIDDVSWPLDICLTIFHFCMRSLSLLYFMKTPETQIHRQGPLDAWDHLLAFACCCQMHSLVNVVPGSQQSKVFMHMSCIAGCGFGVSQCDTRKQKYRCRATSAFLVGQVLLVASR